jgi:hypothetical protein
MVVLDCEIIYILVITEHTTEMPHKSNITLETRNTNTDINNPRLLQCHFLQEQKSVCWCNSEGYTAKAEELYDIHKGREVGCRPK